MGKLREFLGEYNDLDKALRRPELVRKLSIQFDKIPADYSFELAKFTKLRLLDIRGPVNYTRHLPEQIGGLKTLKRLSILNIPLEELPNWIYSLSNLEYLMVRGCEIKSISSEIINLRRLKTLWIENCELNLLPPELGAMLSLKHLSISDTKLNIIDIENLPPNLETLNVVMTYIDKNEISRIKQQKPKLKIE